MLKKFFIFFLIAAVAMTGMVSMLIKDIDAGAESYNRKHPAYTAPVSEGDASLFAEGKTLYTSLFHDIKLAKKYIYIQFFIIRNDKISREFLSLLQKKAEAGVEVRLSVDAIGGSDMTRKMIKELEMSGVLFVKSRPLSPRHIFYRLNHRNHRKIAVVDGNVSYIGGFNIGEEYLGNNPKFGYWRDYHVRLTGSGSAYMAEQFLKDWNEDTGQNIRLRSTDSGAYSGYGHEKYELVFSTGDDLEQKMVQWINRSASHIMIATPYFIPTDALMKALEDSLNRGVKVELLIPDKPDYWFTKPPSYPMTKKLLEKGAIIYLYRKGFFHGKVMVIDGKFADIGTANWDKRSVYLNDEANCLFYSGPIVSEIKKELQKDFSSSRILTKDMYHDIPFWERILERTPEWIYELF
ncbi:cardiolipin synthase [Bacillus sp. FJAT-42376]|uniref:phospholipase D-like domain-containing protein n=1 Tax=Bacillus sp. FJAT-42376 TaxID=2014076 RepID=UPI000F4FC65E|nr:phospholipase D-like domain-containing protein [Bacillus sp. FJAT-42376]AZB43149.1 cardiolipin synthase [Bacillus sp. FJAT-42376]